MSTIDRLPGLHATFNLNLNNYQEYTTGSPAMNNLLNDSVMLSPGGDITLESAMTALNDFKKACEAQQNSPVSTVSLTYPALTQAAARNNTPVIVVHGTLREKESISKYNEASLAEGHPTDFNTYLTIKDGQPLEVSGQIISQNVNEARVDVARNNLNALRHGAHDREKLMEFFQMSPDLHGRTDESVDKIAALLPHVIERLDTILSMKNATLSESLSTRLKEYEAELSADILSTGFAGSVRDTVKRQELAMKCAAEIVESIAPRPFLVGHSMGGFVSYVIGVNPKESLDDRNPCTYDAGNGVSTVMVLSSPVAKGVRRPLPTGLSSLSYDLYERYVLNPLEQSPAMQLALMNPLFAAWNASAKAMTKASSQVMTETSSSFINPYIYLQKPGVEQISEGSHFIRDYVEGKQVPAGTTVVAVTNRLDGVSEADRSCVDENQANAHNLHAELDITSKDLKEPTDTTPRVAHFKMADYPVDHWGQLKKEICQNPVNIPRVLDMKNHDGIRYNTLIVLLADTVDNREYLKTPEMKSALQEIRRVAEEKQPFKDTPSYIARQILNVVDHNAVLPKPNTGNWVLSATATLPLSMKTWPSSRLLNVPIQAKGNH